MTPEGRIKTIINKGLKSLQLAYPGRLVVRMPVMRGMGKPMLDYVICANGSFVLIEAKRDDKHDLTPQQRATRREFEQAGAFVFKVCDAYSADTAINAIEKIIK